MPYDPKQHQRRSIRWFGRDYAQIGAYFVTVCTHGHTCLFGRVVDDAMQLNAAGRMVEECWRLIPTHFPHVALDEFIVMPNHIHGILMIVGPDPNHDPPVGANNHSPSPREHDGPTRTVNDPRMGPDHHLPMPGPNHQPPVGANNHSPPPREHDGPICTANDPRTGADHHLFIPGRNRDPCVRANDYSPLRVRGTSKTVGSIIRGFKIGVTKWMRQNTAIRDLWQRNYYEHVIRNEQSLHHIRRYIADNPAAWLHDPENPQGNPHPNDIDRGNE